MTLTHCRIISVRLLSEFFISAVFEENIEVSSKPCRRRRHRHRHLRRHRRAKTLTFLSLCHY